MDQKSLSLQKLPSKGLPTDDQDSGVHDFLLALDDKYARLSLEEYKIFPFDGIYDKSGIIVADVDYFFRGGEIVPRRSAEVAGKPLTMVLKKMGKYCLEQRDPDLAVAAARSADETRDIVLEAKKLQTKLVMDILGMPNPSLGFIAKSVQAFYAPQKVDRPRTA